MNLYEYQQSGSFIDLGPRSLRFNIFKHLFLRNSWANWSQIPCGASIRWGNELIVQMIQVTYPNMVKTLKIFFGTKRLMTLKVGMQHCLLKYYQVCSNDEPGMTLTYFTARSNLVPYAFVWEKSKTMAFSETIVVYDIKVGTCRCGQLNGYMKLWVPKVKVIHWLCFKSLADSMFLKFFTSITTDFNISSALRWAIQDQWSSALLYISSKNDAVTI